MSTSDLAWFKSSYSGGDGDDCVEVALSWRKSSYSSGGDGDCVEIAACPTTIHVRDSKDKQGPQLALSPHRLGRFRHARQEVTVGAARFFASVVLPRPE